MEHELISAAFIIRRRLQPTEDGHTVGLRAQSSPST